jgi:hypothetical protein
MVGLVWMVEMYRMVGMVGTVRMAERPLYLMRALWTAR